jgi:hypothetical protein
MSALLLLLRLLGETEEGIKCGGCGEGAVEFSVEGAADAFCDCCNLVSLKRSSAGSAGDEIYTMQ